MYTVTWLTIIKSINQLWHPIRKNTYYLLPPVRLNCILAPSVLNTTCNIERCEQMCHASLRRQNRCNHNGSNTVSTSHNFNIAPKRGSSKGYRFNYSSNLVLFGSTTVHCRFVEMFLGRMRWLRGGKEKQGWQSLNFRMDISGLSGRGLEEKVPIFAASFSWAAL